mgnify:CR=1
NMGRDSGKKGKSSYRRQLKDTSRGARVKEVDSLRLRGTKKEDTVYDVLLTHKITHRTSENKELNEFDRLWGYEIFS